MTTAPRRTGSLAAAVLAALTLALSVLVATPANAATPKLQNQERPWFSGPVCLEIDQSYSSDRGYGQVEWCSYNSVQQQWTAVPVPNNPGYYELKNNETKRCLAVKDGVFADGTRTIQTSCATAPNVPAENQQWKFISAGNAWYEVVARHSGKCLTNSGWNALQSNCDGSAKQHWTRPF